MNVWEVWLISFFSRGGCDHGRKWYVPYPHAVLYHTQRAALSKVVFIPPRPFLQQRKRTGTFFMVIIKLAMTKKKSFPTWLERMNERNDYLRAGA